MTLTVVGESLAKKGLEFVYRGENDPACAPCKLRKVCHGLAPGRLYRVTEVRPVKHDVCTVFEGKVQVVGVEEVPFAMNVPRTSLRGTMVRRHFEECGFKACRFRGACLPETLPEGGAAQILEVGEKVPCPAGRDLRRIRAGRV